jgi:peptidase S41-like protein
MSRLFTLTRAFGVILTGTIAWSAPLRAQARIPDTPAGHALRDWLDAYNSGDSARVAGFLRTYQVEYPYRESFQFREMTGGFDLLRIEVSEPRHIEFLLRFRKPGMVGYGALDVTPGDPTRIGGDLQPLGPNVSAEALRIDGGTRAAVVGRAAAVLDSFYFSPAIGKQLSDSLRARLARGAYNRYTTGPGLGIRLKADLDAIAHDRHLWVRYSVSPLHPERSAGEAPPIPSREDVDENNCGFKKVEQLDGNVGYVRFDSFEEAELCGATASAAMTFLAGTRALIIDLRENGGGKPDMVALIASCLFDRRTHLGDLWDRYADSTHHYWTEDNVAGRRFGGAKPVYVLTSAHTFSAAEEFAYDLQALKRVTIVGEATGWRRASGVRGTFGGSLRDQCAVGEFHQSYYGYELGGRRSLAGPQGARERCTGCRGEA